MRDDWHIVWGQATAMPLAWTGTPFKLLLAGAFAWMGIVGARRLRAAERSLAALSEVERAQKIRASLGLYSLIENPLLVALIPPFLAIALLASVMPGWLRLSESLNTGGLTTASGPVQSAKAWFRIGQFAQHEHGEVRTNRRR